MAVALVTGTSTGIGFAIAESLARAGHDVFATMRDPDGAPGLADLARRDALPITVLPMDVDRDASVAATVGEVLAARGRIDALVNNAGVGAAGAVESIPLAEFRRVMETNYFGALRCIQAVLPGMREARSGLIVNITSVAGRIATPGQGPYAASKFALEALSECLAGEVKAHGIRVAIVEPGVIATPIFGKMNQSPVASPYPQRRRLQALFAASLQRPVPPSVVGDCVRDILERDSWQLRYPVGPDAVPFLKWRASQADEDIVSFWSLEDEPWCAFVETHFGMNVRPHLGLA